MLLALTLLPITDKKDLDLLELSNSTRHTADDNKSVDSVVPDVTSITIISIISMSFLTIPRIGGPDNDSTRQTQVVHSTISPRQRRFGGISVSATCVFLLAMIVLPDSLVTAFDPPSVFPASMRQALADKSKAINPTGNNYGTAGWSNRPATVLTPISISESQSNSNVYTADRPFYWNKIDVSCRMTVVELPPPAGSDSSSPLLWVHSPVAADGPMQQVISKLSGRVEHVVSSNYEHLKFAPEWARSYPEAYFWGCPGLSERMPEMPWTGEVPDGYRPAGWKGAAQESPLLPASAWDRNLIQALHVNVEVNPATGKPFFNEVIYFHTVSKTLIVTDLFWNYPASTVPNSEFGVDDSWELAPVVSDIPIGSRLWKVGMDKVYAPFYNALMVQDKAAYKDIARHIVDVWQPEIVIPAHGDILRGKDFIRKVLTKYFDL